MGCQLEHSASRESGPRLRGCAGCGVYRFYLEVAKVPMWRNSLQRKCLGDSLPGRLNFLRDRKYMSKVI